MVVLTADGSLREQCEARLAGFQKLLAAAAQQTPVRVEWKGK
jgi:hypothetical protein